MVWLLRLFCIAAAEEMDGLGGIEMLISQQCAYLQLLQTTASQILELIILVGSAAFSRPAK